MTLYEVHIHETQSLVVFVEADTPAEAKEKARLRAEWLDWDDQPTTIGPPRVQRDPAKTVETIKQ